MTESLDQDQPMVDKPQVAIGSVVGSLPSNPPPPPPGAGMTHADDVTGGWANDDDSNNTNDANWANSPARRHEVSDDEVSDDEPSSQTSGDDDDASEASEDAISVLAQAAVEEAMEAAVRQAQSPDATNANHDSSNANFAVSYAEQDLTSMEANNSPTTRPLAVVGTRPAGGLFQHYHDDKNTDDSEEERGEWRFGENSPPLSSPCLTSRCSPCLTNQTQPSNCSDNDDDGEESRCLQEVTSETNTCVNSQRLLPL